MNAADAKRAGANVPGIYFAVGHAEYNPGADGYLVIYDDGYRSWSPARVFEGSYKVADTHVDRLKIDLDELNERICMETRAINTFGVISEEEKNVGTSKNSWTQCGSMQTFSMTAYAVWLMLAVSQIQNPPVVQQAPRKEVNNGTVD